MLRGNPLNPLHFPPNFLKMALVCQNALRQTACPVPPDVVYAFVLSLGQVYHSRVKALHNFRFGEKQCDKVRVIDGLSIRGNVGRFLTFRAGGLLRRLISIKMFFARQN